MEIILIGIWLFLLVIIPIVSLFTITYSFGNSEGNIGLFIRIIIATFAYIISSFFSGWIIALIVIGPHPDPNKVFGLGEFIFVSVVVLGYGFSGWVINCFIAKDIVIPKKLLNKGKTKSIFAEG